MSEQSLGPSRIPDRWQRQDTSSVGRAKDDPGPPTVLVNLYRLSEEYLVSQEFLDRVESVCSSTLREEFDQRWRGQMQTVRDMIHAMRWIEERMDLDSDINKQPSQSATVSTTNLAKATKPKRSTGRNEGRQKLIASLTLHHQYENGSCLNLDPINNNELARQADVANSTASDFFDWAFKPKDDQHNSNTGYEIYRVKCRDAGKLVGCLKALNGEILPADLYGRAPPGEEGRDDDA